MQTVILPKQNTFYAGGIMKTLHLMVGLPRSGKSTFAQKLGYPRVEPDAIRNALHGTPWRPNAEPIVWGVAHIMVDALFAAGHDNVILDATNHTLQRRAEWESNDYVIKYHEVKTSVSECIQRAHATNQQYLIPIIERMAKQYVPVGELDG
jgi:predicted kinase